MKTMKATSCRAFSVSLSLSFWPMHKRLDAIQRVSSVNNNKIDAFWIIVIYREWEWMGSFLWRGREKERVIDKLIRSNHCRDHFLITRRRTAVDLLETQTQSGHVGHILRVRRCPPGKRRRFRCLPLSLASSALSVNKSHRYVALSSLIH